MLDHMSQKSAFVGCVYGPNTSPMLHGRKKANINTEEHRHPGSDFQKLQFSHPFWKITKLVRRVRTGARKLESFRSFGRKKKNEQCIYPRAGRQNIKGGILTVCSSRGCVVSGNNPVAEKQSRLWITFRTKLQRIITLRNCAAYLRLKDTGC